LGIGVLASKLNAAYPQHTFSGPEFPEWDWIIEKCQESNGAIIHFETFLKHKGFNQVQLSVIVNHKQKNVQKYVVMSYTFKNGVWVLVSAEIAA
jgi:hypothetical protein